MAISYPISLPSSPGPRSFELTATTFAALTASPWTGSQQAQLNQGQMWGFSVELPPMSDADARAWFGALLQLNGQYGTFLYGDKKWTAPRGTWAGSPVVDGNSQSGQTLAMRGFSAAATVKTGDFFQHGEGSDTHLYMVTADGTADGSGDLSMEIWPRLRNEPIDGDTLVTSSPKGLFRMANPVVTRSWEPFRNGLTFQMVEAL